MNFYSCFRISRRLAADIRNACSWLVDESEHCWKVSAKSNSSEESSRGDSFVGSSAVLLIFLTTSSSDTSSDSSSVEPVAYVDKHPPYPIWLCWSGRSCIHPSHTAIRWRGWSKEQVKQTRTRQSSISASRIVWHLVQVVMLRYMITDWYHTGDIS